MIMPLHGSLHAYFIIPRICEVDDHGNKLELPNDSGWTDEQKSAWDLLVTHICKLLISSYLSTQTEDSKSIHPGLPTSEKSLIATVISLAKIYLPAYSIGYDNDDDGQNGKFHGCCRDILVGNYQRWDLNKALADLVYRLSIMSAADEYLSFMQIPKPNGQNCITFPTYELKDRTGKERCGESAIDELESLVDVNEILFPEDPEYRLAGECRKGIEYLAAAFWFKGIGKEDMEARLQVLVEWVGAVVEEKIKVMEKDEETVRLKRKMLVAFGY